MFNVPLHLLFFVFDIILPQFNERLTLFWKIFQYMSFSKLDFSSPSQQTKSPFTQNLFHMNCHGSQQQKSGRNPVSNLVILIRYVAKNVFRCWMKRAILVQKTQMDKFHSDHNNYCKVPVP